MDATTGPPFWSRFLYKLAGMSGLLILNTPAKQEWYSSLTPTQKNVCIQKLIQTQDVKDAGGN